MTSINKFGNQNFYSKQTSPIDDLVVKAEETMRRTNLQNAAKTPAGVAAAALKYIALDAVKANVLPEEVKNLNVTAAIKQYSNI